MVLLPSSSSGPPFMAVASRYGCTGYMYGCSEPPSTACGGYGVCAAAKRGVPLPCLKVENGR